MMETNLERLFRQPGSHAELCEQTAALRAMVISLCQDVAVLKHMLSERGLWDKASYKHLRMAEMISDHSSVGCAPWQAYSYYPYTLGEADFLRRSLACDEDEVRKFRADVEHISSLT